MIRGVRGSPEPAGPADPGPALLAFPVRRAIVEVLRRYDHDGGGGTARAGGMTAAQLAAEIGLHVTTVRFHLGQLDRAGLVTSHFTTVFGVGRPRKIYAAAPSRAEPDGGASHLMLLAGLLTASFGADLTPVQAGQRWAREHVDNQDGGPATTPGDWLAKLGRLVDVLRRWGYTPDLTTADGGRSCRIDLVDCPFMELARASQEVVCGIHRGLLTGALNRLGEDRAEVRLVPFVGPNLCHAHIRTRQPFHPFTEESPDAS